MKTVVYMLGYGFVVAEYVTVSLYAPFGCEEVARSPYQTCVASFDAATAVVFTVTGEALDGTPAHVELLEALLVSALYAVAPKPPALTIR